MSDSNAPAADTGKKFWFIWLAPGISRVHAGVFLYSAFATIGLLTFVSTGTALVFNNVLGIPIEDQGRLSGDLVVVTELVQLAVFGIAGVAADRIGRREVFAFGLFVMGLGYLLYPFAQSFEALLVYRGIYALGLGASTGMLGTVLADYPQDRSRGAFVALAGVFNGLGVLVVTLAFGKQVPPMLVEAGFDSMTVARITHIIVFAACAVSSVLVFFGLKKGAPTTQEEKLPIKELIIGGLTEAKNPRIALAYASAFVARSDLVILGTFLVLWGTVAGIEQGLDPSIAASRGAGIFGIAQGAALLWLMLIGGLADRFNRVSFASFCMFVAAIGYGAMLFVDDPLSRESIPLFLLLGVGQISAFFGATTLISQEAPRVKRGTVIGMFNMSGAIGILVASAAGGRLFDSVGPAAPFALIGALNLFVFVFGFIVRLKAPGPIPGKTAQETS